MLLSYFNWSITILHLDLQSGENVYVSELPTTDFTVSLNRYVFLSDSKTFKSHRVWGNFADQENVVGNFFSLIFRKAFSVFGENCVDVLALIYNLK